MNIYQMIRLNLSHYIEGGTSYGNDYDSKNSC